MKYPQKGDIVVFQQVTEGSKIRINSIYKCTYEDSSIIDIQNTVSQIKHSILKTNLKNFRFTITKP